MLPLIIVTGVIFAFWVLRQAGHMTPQQSRRFARQISGYALCGVGALMGLRGNFAVAVPVFTIGAGLLGFNGLLAQMNAKSAPPSNIPISRHQAYNILGLQEGASADEIRAAHKRLQRAAHPDAGGSTYLAAQINAARDLLLNK